MDATTLGALGALLVGAGGLATAVVTAIGKRGENALNGYSSLTDNLQEERDGLRLQLARAPSAACRRSKRDHPATHRDRPGAVLLVWACISAEAERGDQLAAEADRRGTAVSTLATDGRRLRTQIKGEGRTPVAPDPTQAVEDLPSRAEVPVPIPGPRGEPGRPGRDGAPGTTGSPRPSGLSGQPGTDGKDEAPGQQGAQGEPGPAGPQGPAGPRGADGKDGRDGADGTNGHACPDGYSLQPPPDDPRRLGVPPRRCARAGTHPDLDYTGRPRPGPRGIARLGLVRFAGLVSDLTSCPLYG